MTQSAVLGYRTSRQAMDLAGIHGAGSLVDASARWHEEMVLDGVPAPGEGLAVPHELTDFQKDFLGAKADLLAARRQLDAAGKAVF